MAPVVSLAEWRARRAAAGRVVVDRARGRATTADSDSGRAATQQRIDSIHASLARIDRLMQHLRDIQSNPHNGDFE